MCEYCLPDMPCPDCLLAALVGIIEEIAVEMEEADESAVWFEELQKSYDADRGL